MFCLLSCTLKEETFCGRNFQKKILKIYVACLGPSEFFAGIKFSEWMREDFIF